MYTNPYNGLTGGLNTARLEGVNTGKSLALSLSVFSGKQAMYQKT